MRYLKKVKKNKLAFTFEIVPQLEKETRVCALSRVFLDVVMF